MLDMQLFPSKLDKRNIIDQELSMNQIRFMSPERSLLNKKAKQNISYSYNDTNCIRKSSKSSELNEKTQMNQINQINQSDQTNQCQLSQKKVKFLPDNKLITIINIESYKKFNLEHTARNPTDITSVKCHCKLF